MPIYRGVGGSGDASTDAYASQVAESANTATTKANEAAASAAAAAASASSASSSVAAVDADAAAAAASAAAASTSASNAATSASNASTSASNASTSAANAATSESNAATSATNASNSASAASTSETNASASASAASTSASNAATSETNASNSASAAATSAANAATSESNAATSASTASTAATNAANSFDQFDDIYLGAKASAPALDNDGDPLQTGALYYDTTASEFRVYNGSSWIAAGSAVNGTSQRQTYTATGGQTVFAITYDIGFVDVYLNGVRLVATTDFTATSGADITLTTGATAGDIVDIIAYGAFTLANHYTQAQSDARYYTQAQVDTKLLEVEGTEIVSTGVSAGFYLAADGDNTSSWQQIVIPPQNYLAWSVKTGVYTAVNGDQLACNGTFTVTLPATPSAGDTVVIANVGAGVITVGRNGSNINSLAEDGTLNADTSTQLVYIDGTIGWKEI